MENVNKGSSQQQNSEDAHTDSPNQFNDPNQVVNQEEQNRSVNTGDEDYKENVTGRTPEQPPRDLNLSGNTNAAEDAGGGAQVETPHKHEGDDEESTERKIPKM
jgi:hypothetical protein